MTEYNAPTPDSKDALGTPCRLYASLRRLGHSMSHSVVWHSPKTSSTTRVTLLYSYLKCLFFVRIHLLLLTVSTSGLYLLYRWVPLLAYARYWSNNDVLCKKYTTYSTTTVVWYNTPIYMPLEAKRFSTDITRVSSTRAASKGLIRGLGYIYTHSFSLFCFSLFRIAAPSISLSIFWDGMIINRRLYS